MLAESNYDASQGWKKQLEFQLIDSSYIASACIMDKESGQIWGTTHTHFMPVRKNEQDLDEIKGILKLVHGDPAFSIQLCNQKYFILRTASQPFVVYARSLKDSKPLCITCTKKSILLAIGSDEVPGNLNSILEGFRDYLTQLGY